MKKIVITLLIGYSFSFASVCEKMQIDELKYMKKEELISAYKEQNAFYNLNLKYIDKANNSGKEYMDKGMLGTAKGFYNDAGKLIKDNSCYSQNKTNIQRVLEKDFKIDEKKLNDLISKMK